MNLIEWLEVFCRGFKSISKKKLALLLLIFLASNSVYAQEGETSPTSVAEEVSAEVTPTPTPASNDSVAPETVQADTPPSESPTSTPAPSPQAAAAGSTAQKSATFKLKTARDDIYTKPVYFEAMESLLPTMEFEYDLTLNEGKSLRVGDTSIDDQTFFFALVPVSKFHSKITSVIGAKEAAKTALVIRWPEILQQTGTLELISRSGSVIWKTDITEAKRESWKKKLEGWKSGLEKLGVKTARLPKSSVFSTQYGIIDVPSQGLKPFKESFRFCLSYSQGRAQSRLCSQRYVIQGTKAKMTMGKVKTTVEPRVLFQNQSAPLKQTVSVPRDMPTTFFAELASGESYEFIAIPNKLNLMDLTDSKKPDHVRIVGWGVRPSIPSVILNPDDYSAFTRAIGFESTIGDLRKFWEVNISSEDPKLYLPGQGGGLFIQRFDLSEVPRAKARPYLEIFTPSGTYDDGAKLFGKKLPEVKITSSENSIEVDDKDPRYFVWRFKALERGEMNRSYLSTEFEGKEYKAFYELYKGFPRELSARLSGILQTSGEFVFLGEVAYNHWFENFFGWTHYWVGRQRWGVSGKYFKSLVQLTTDKTKGTKADLAVANVDLKYRLTPGLWGRDETVGAMLDYQHVIFGDFNAAMIGVGAFWARSMPKVFDDFFNKLPLMQYPKWVDMEFIYYPLPLTPQVRLLTNLSLNFHGKVLWTKHWFGEAGFGMKRYAIHDLSLGKSGQSATLNTFYGTVGLGLSF